MGINLAFWENLTEFLRSDVASYAEEIDQNGVALGEVLQGLGDRRLLGLRVPTEWGGSGLSLADYYAATVKITAASGILAFLQTQHQSAAAQIAKFGSAKQKELLPKMVTGEIKVGVGFSHLRRQGKPMLVAKPQGDVFLLTGIIPWITGHGFFRRAIAGATLPNGDELYGLIPLQNTQQSNGGTIDCGTPLPLAAMGQSKTVTVKLNQWLLAPEDVLVIKPAGSIQRGDRHKVLHHGFFALGCAHGILESLATANFSEIQSLKSQLSKLHHEMFQAIADPPADFQTQLQLRIKAVALAQQYAAIALTTAGGAGNLLTHPAQRHYREALMFSIFGQTPTIRNATLQTLLPEYRTEIY
ncbi:MAG: acyl-CoA dehydrogenase family protein [Limnothrix sp.]